MNYNEALKLNNHDPVRIKSTGDLAEVLTMYVDHDAKEIIVYVEREDEFTGVKHTEIRDIGDLE